MGGDWFPVAPAPFGLKMERPGDEVARLPMRGRTGAIVVRIFWLGRDETFKEGLQNHMLWRALSLMWVERFQLAAVTDQENSLRRGFHDALRSVLPRKVKRP